MLDFSDLNSRVAGLYKRVRAGWMGISGLLNWSLSKGVALWLCQ